MTKNISSVIIIFSHNFYGGYGESSIKFFHWWSVKKLPLDLIKDLDLLKTKMITPIHFQIQFSRPDIDRQKEKTIINSETNYLNLNSSDDVRPNNFKIF